REHSVAPPLRSYQARDGAIGRSRIPDALAEQQKTRTGKIAERAVGELRDGKLRAREGAEHVGEGDRGTRHVVGELLRVGAGFAGSVYIDVDALGLLWVELKITGDEGAVRSGRIALERVHEAIAFDGVLAGSRRRSTRFAGAGDRERVGDVEAEGGGVTVGGIVGERKPARGEKEIGAIAGDGRGAHPGNGAIFFVGQ